MRNQFAKIAMMFALATAAVLATGTGAMAQITAQEAFNLFGTEYGDPFSSVFLNQIFGPLFPSASGTNATTVFSEIIGYFNIIMLVVGGLLFFHNFTVGLLQTAHEGSVLGNRWSSLWAPLRVIFAVGLLVPLPNAGGYNLAQSGVAYIVRGATNIASIVWSEAATLVISGAAPITTTATMLDPEMVGRAYDNAVCRAIVSDQLALAGQVGNNPLSLGTVTEASDGRITVHSIVVNPNGANFNRGICGSHSTPELPSYISNLYAGAPADNLGLDITQRSVVETNFRNAHVAALNSLNSGMDTIVGTHYAAIKSSQPVDADQVSEAISTLMTTIGAQLNTDISGVIDSAMGADRTGQTARQALLDRITGNCTNASPDAAAASLNAAEATRCYGEGWVGAGSWYMMMARLNNEVSSLTEASSTVTSGTYIDRVTFNASQDTLLQNSGGESSMWAGRREGYREDAGMATYDEAARISNGFSAVFEDATARLAALGFTFSSAQLGELMETVTNMDGWLPAVPGLRQALISATENLLNLTSPGGAGSDPMTGMITVGQMMMAIAVLLIGVVSLSSFVGVSLAVMISPFVVALLTTGSMMAYIMPMMPFFFWVLAVSGYFLLIIEAVIAVNLWALAHMRMDGEGISGEAGRNGWLMLLSLMMTPVLMIFGFLVGMTIFRVTSTLINIGIHQAIAGIASGGVAAQFIAMIVYAILIATFYMVIIERSFSLVSEFPGRVLRWIGAGSELTRGEEDRVRMASVAAGAMVYSGASGLAGKADKYGEARKAARIEKRGGSITKSGG